MGFLSTLEPQVFLYILSSISEGLTALGGTLNHYTGRYLSGTYMRGLIETPPHSLSFLLCCLQDLKKLVMNELFLFKCFRYFCICYPCNIFDTFLMLQKFSSIKWEVCSFCHLLVLHLFQFIYVSDCTWHEYIVLIFSIWLLTKFELESSEMFLIKIFAEQGYFFGSVLRK